MLNSSLMLQTNSSLLDGKNREIKELKSQLNRSKETNKMMNKNLMNLQQQVHLLTQKLEGEEKRSNILAKTYGDTQKKLARAEVRLRHVQRTVQELEAENFELNNELERLRNNKKNSTISLDDSLEVWDNDGEIKTEDEEMEELEEQQKEDDEGDEHMELLQREIDNLLTDSGTFSSRSCETNGGGGGGDFHNQNNGTFNMSEAMAGPFGVFSSFSPFIKASLSRSQSESMPINPFAHLTDKQSTATQLQYNFNHILATLSNGVDYDDHQNNCVPEESQMHMRNFDFFAGFSPFVKGSLSRSQSDSKPTNSFANIAAKPPTSTNTQYNYNQQLRMIMPQPVGHKKSSPTTLNDNQHKRTDKGENGELKTALTGDEENKIAKNYLHKTQICLFWKAYMSGQSRIKCRNGVNCNFAHGEKELKKLDPLYFKTELCEFWNSDEPCPYGDGCNFAHGPDELRQMGVKGSKSAAKTPSFYNNRQRLRKTRTKTQTIQPQTSYGKPVEQKVTIINGH